MTSRKNRAFHFGGASWLLLCAMGNGATAQDAATPPLLELPQAVELLHLTTGAEFTHLGSLHRAFQSRAPPVS